MDDSNKRLKIAFLTIQDPLSKRTWSGTSCAMARALQKQCGDVTFLGPVPAKQIGGKLYNRLVRFLLKKRYDYSHSLSYARKCAKYFEKKLDGQAFDVIFAPAASTGLAFLNTTVPIIYASDVTFSLIHNYYPEFTNLLHKSIREGNVIENAAINKSRIALFSSEWAARSAARDYGAKPENIRVIPFGANLDTAPEKEIVLNRKKSSGLRLLFLAVNWLRKGGDIAYETLLSLIRSGVNAELIVCGCVPPSGLSHERMTVIPFLDKEDPIQRQTLNDLFLSSDFLLLPTRYDCTPIVFCEANAFGLPVVTTETGGVSDVIRNGENGIVLPFTARGDEYAGMIVEIFNDDQRFTALKRSSRQTYDERLNWDSWAVAVQSIFDEILQK
jgi:glycosyltransferase involved in cell wall biosynthesis